jgi:hypothetical protein
MRGMRRLHKCNWSIPHSTERWAQQSQFAHTCLLYKQVDERTNGLATAGQLGRQRWIARVNDPTKAPGSLGRPP